MILTDCPCAIIRYVTAIWCKIRLENPDSRAPCAFIGLPAHTHTHTHTRIPALFKISFQTLRLQVALRVLVSATGFFYQRQWSLSCSLSHLLSPDITHIIISQSIRLHIAWIAMLSGFCQAGAFSAPKDRHSEFLCSLHKLRFYFLFLSSMIIINILATCFLPVMASLYHGNSTCSNKVNTVCIISIIMWQSLKNNP